MFVAEALYSFSQAALTAESEKGQQQPLYKEKSDAAEQRGHTLKRLRQEEHDQELAKEGQDRFYGKDKGQKDEQRCSSQEKDQKKEQIAYLNLQKGDKILVEQAFQNGWWYGHAIKRPDQKGFFPSNYVKVGAKPPPPAPTKKQSEEDQSDDLVYEDQKEVNEVGGKLEELGSAQKGPVSSDYYQGITRYKYVRINDSNKNLLNASYVKFDANTGLAKVPVKDQAPCSKAVRQMGYYFDYHQWNEERNRDPNAYKSRPDARKKKQKKLHLVGMGKDA